MRADVRVVPLAIGNDAGVKDKVLKDFGRIDPTKVVRFSFGAPLAVIGRGTDQNQQIIDYIATKLEGW